MSPKELLVKFFGIIPHPSICVKYLGIDMKLSPGGLRLRKAKINQASILHESRFKKINAIEQNMC